MVNCTWSLISHNGTSELQQFQTESTPWKDDRLQVLLDTQPDLIPIGKIDGRVEPPLVSLGRKTGTANGFIDNLFISSNGFLIVVAPHVWINEAALRGTIDRAFHDAEYVRRAWSYAHLGKLATAAGRAQTLHELIGPLKPRQDWVNQVIANVRGGPVTLVVADSFPAGLAPWPLPRQTALLELSANDSADGGHVVRRTAVVPAPVPDGIAEWLADVTPQLGHGFTARRLGNHPCVLVTARSGDWSIVVIFDQEDELRVPDGISANSVFTEINKRFGRASTRPQGAGGAGFADLNQGTLTNEGWSSSSDRPSRQRALLSAVWIWGQPHILRALTVLRTEQWSRSAAQNVFQDKEYLEGREFPDWRRLYGIPKNCNDIIVATLR